MEPVAPGTEDDPQIAYSTLTKQVYKLKKTFR